MNWLDIVLLILVAGSVVTAFSKGLTRELIGFAAVIAGLVLGSWFYGTAAGYLYPYLRSRPLANLVGFLLIFGAVVLLGGLAARIFRGLMKATGLSFFDRLLGAGFGAIRGVVIAVALLMAVMAFGRGPNPPRPIIESKFAPYVMDAARFCASMAPYELREGFRDSYDEVKSAWNHTVRKGMRALPSKKEDPE
ncbi:MAG: CvpA family protein [Acidobacteria bacterium]|nr:CvpA family protein [Acidobacteriota bacterium]